MSRKTKVKGRGWGGDTRYYTQCYLSLFALLSVCYCCRRCIYARTRVQVMYLREARVENIWLPCNEFAGKFIKNKAASIFGRILDMQTTFQQLLL